MLGSARRLDVSAGAVSVCCAARQLEGTANAASVRRRRDGRCWRRVFLRGRRTEERGADGGPALTAHSAPLGGNVVRRSLLACPPHPARHTAQRGQSLHAP